MQFHSSTSINTKAQHTYEVNVKTQSFPPHSNSFPTMLSAALVSLSVLAIPVLSQALKLGYVDSQAIIQQLPEAQDAQKRIQSSLEQWQAQIDTMAKAYQTHLEEYDKKKTMMNDQAKLAE